MLPQVSVSCRFLWCCLPPLTFDLCFFLCSQLYRVNYPSLCDNNILRRVLVSEVLYGAEKLKNRWMEEQADGICDAVALCQTEGAGEEFLSDEADRVKSIVLSFYLNTNRIHVCLKCTKLYTYSMCRGDERFNGMEWCIRQCWKTGVLYIMQVSFLRSMPVCGIKERQHLPAFYFMSFSLLTFLCVLIGLWLYHWMCCGPAVLKSVC